MRLTPVAVNSTLHTLTEYHNSQHVHALLSEMSSTCDDDTSLHFTSLHITSHHITHLTHSRKIRTHVHKIHANMLGNRGTNLHMYMHKYIKRATHTHFLLNIRPYQTRPLILARPTLNAQRPTLNALAAHGCVRGDSTYTYDTI